MAESCFKRFPYASAVATLVMLVGTGLFCGCLYEGVSDTQLILKSKFNINIEIEWVSSLKLALVVAAAVMGGFAIALFWFGFLATGSTRAILYTREKCIIGGRCIALLFMILTYLFNLVWTVAVSLLGIPILVLIMMRSMCYTELTNADYQAGEGGLQIFCLNLTRFGLYFANYSSLVPSGSGPALPVCYTNDLRDICTWVNKDIPLFSTAFGGCYLIVIGLVSFLMITGVNYQRIKSSRELTDFRTAIDLDNTELDNIIASANKKQTFQGSFASI